MDLEIGSHIKVHWTIPDAKKGGLLGENLWAKYLGGNLAEIDNIPFCANDEFALGDTIRFGEKDGFLEIVEVIKRRNRTIFALWESESGPRPAICDKCQPEILEEYNNNVSEVDKENWERIKEHFKKYKNVKIEAAFVGYFSISVSTDMDNGSIEEMCDGCPVSLNIEGEQ